MNTKAKPEPEFEPDFKLDLDTELDIELDALLADLDLAAQGEKQKARARKSKSTPREPRGQKTGTGIYAKKYNKRDDKQDHTEDAIFPIRARWQHLAPGRLEWDKHTHPEPQRGGPDLIDTRRDRDLLVRLHTEIKTAHKDCERERNITTYTNNLLLNILLAAIYN